MVCQQRDLTGELYQKPPRFSPTLSIVLITPMMIMIASAIFIPIRHRSSKYARVYKFLSQVYGYEVGVRFGLSVRLAMTGE